MPQDQSQPIKLLGSLVDSNYRVVDTYTSGINPPGKIVDAPVFSSPAVPGLSEDFISMYTLAGGNLSLVSQFFATLNKNNGGIPGDIRDFASKYAKFLVAQGIIPDTEIAINSAVKDVLNGFLKSYLSAISYFSATEGAYMQSLFSPPIASLGDVDADNVSEQFGVIDTAWKSFVGSYPYQLDGTLTSNPVIARGFFQNFREFTAPAATITTGYNVIVNNGSGGTLVATSSTTPSFETTFYQYFPALAPASPLFGQYLDLFQKDMIAKYGHFSPGRQYTEWVPFVQKLANITAPAVATLPVQDVRILNDILFLVIQMILSIQHVAASQADRLSLYTTWQKGYTDLLSQVHVFTGSSDDKLKDFSSGNPFTDNPSLSDVQKKRQDEQGNFNAGMVQQVTAYKDTVSEDAKALQSRVNQSSDAFNDQANTATAILQEISTILSAIFR